MSLKFTNRQGRLVVKFNLKFNKWKEINGNRFKDLFALGIKSRNDSQFLSTSFFLHTYWVCVEDALRHYEHITFIFKLWCISFTTGFNLNLYKKGMGIMHSGRHKVFSSPILMGDRNLFNSSHINIYMWF